MAKITPQEIIEMALGSNQDHLNKRNQRQQEETLYKQARRSNIVRPESRSRGLPELDMGTRPDPGGPGATEPIEGAPIEPSSVQSLVQGMAAQRGWSGEEWNALHNLIQKESSWNPNAKNPSSTAGGLFQFLDSTRKSYGITRESPLDKQVNAGLQYIQDRYKTPSGALNHWLSKKPINGKNVGNWY